MPPRPSDCVRPAGRLSVLARQSIKRQPAELHRRLAQVGGCPLFRRLSSKSEGNFFSIKTILIYPSISLPNQYYKFYKNKIWVLNFCYQLSDPFLDCVHTPGHFWILKRNILTSFQPLKSAANRLKLFWSKMCIARRMGSETIRHRKKKKRQPFNYHLKGVLTPPWVLISPIIIK